MTDPLFSHPHSKRIAGALILLLVLTGMWYLLGRTPPSLEPPRRGSWDQPTAVRTVPADLGSMEVQIRSIGTVTPLNTVTVRSRVEGVLERVLFTEGAAVEEGDLLAEIDPLPYRARLAQAEGQLQQNQAQLRNAKADLELYEGLYEQDSIARQQLSSQRALVEELMGTLKANQAEVEDARLQLSWTSIEAPISGKLGLRRVDAGNLVAANDSEGLVTITQMKPISVQFTVPEVEVPALRQAVASDRALQVEALDRAGQQVLAIGELTTLDNQIDTTTGTLRVKALFDNEDDALFPNQFVNVRLRLSTLESVITIPSDAVQYGSRGTYVYVVEEGKAYTRAITLGPAADDRVAVTDGLVEGDQVVLEGLDRLREGKEVILPLEGST
ncbi:MAG: efflux RND transporter periplasmic adaptor subunit [Porticoccaceae bacterium]|nr:efflux RND transporter periplasmic adaptor subunit [Porticoccaceae bacterium]